MVSFQSHELIVANSSTSLVTSPDVVLQGNREETVYVCAEVNGTVNGFRCIVYGAPSVQDRAAGRRIELFRINKNTITLDSSQVVSLPALPVMWCTVDNQTGTETSYIWLIE